MGNRGQVGHGHGLDISLHRASINRPRLLAFPTQHLPHKPRMEDQEGLAIAIEEALLGYKEGGVPVNASPAPPSTLTARSLTWPDRSCIDIQRWQGIRPWSQS